MIHGLSTLKWAVGQKGCQNLGIEAAQSLESNPMILSRHLTKLVCKFTICNGNITDMKRNFAFLLHACRSRTLEPGCCSSRKAIAGIILCVKLWSLASPCRNLQLIMDTYLRQ